MFFLGEITTIEYISIYFVVQIITLSASANNLSKILEQAEEYAALIMEELDHDNLGYIDVSLISFSLFFNFLFFMSFS